MFLKSKSKCSTIPPQSTKYWILFSLLTTTTAHPRKHPPKKSFIETCKETLLSDPNQDGILSQDEYAAFVSPSKNFYELSTRLQLTFMTWVCFEGDCNGVGFEDLEDRRVQRDVELMCNDVFTALKEEEEVLEGSSTFIPTAIVELNSVSPTAVPTLDVGGDLPIPSPTVSPTSSIQTASLTSSPVISDSNPPTSPPTHPISTDTKQPQTSSPTGGPTVTPETATISLSNFSFSYRLDLQRGISATEVKDADNNTIAEDVKKAIYRVLTASERLLFIFAPQVEEEKEIQDVVHDDITDVECPTKESIQSCLLFSSTVSHTSDQDSGAYQTKLKKSMSPYSTDFVEYMGNEDVVDATYVELAALAPPANAQNPIEDKPTHLKTGIAIGLVTFLLLILYTSFLYRKKRQPPSSKPSDSFLATTAVWSFSKTPPETRLGASPAPKKEEAVEVTSVVASDTGRLGAKPLFGKNKVADSSSEVGSSINPSVNLDDTDAEKCYPDGSIAENYTDEFVDETYSTKSPAEPAQNLDQLISMGDWKGAADAAAAFESDVSSDDPVQPQRRGRKFLDLILRGWLPQNTGNSSPAAAAAIVTDGSHEEEKGEVVDSRGMENWRSTCVPYRHTNPGLDQSNPFTYSSSSEPLESYDAGPCSASTLTEEQFSISSSAAIGIIPRKKLPKVSALVNSVNILSSRSRKKSKKDTYSSSSDDFARPPKKKGWRNFIGRKSQNLDFSLYESSFLQEDGSVSSWSMPSIDPELQLSKIQFEDESDLDLTPMPTHFSEEDEVKNERATSLQNALDQAIENGDWDAMDAAMMKEIVVPSPGHSKIASSHDSHSFSSAQSREMPMSPSVDESRIKVLEGLIETDDWQGVVTDLNSSNEFPVAKSIAKGYYPSPTRCTQDDSSGEDDRDRSNVQDDSLLYSGDDEKDAPIYKTPDKKIPPKICTNVSIASDIVPPAVPVSPDDTETIGKNSFEELDEKCIPSEAQASEGKLMPVSQIETCVAAETSPGRSTAFENWSLLLYGNKKKTKASEPAPEPQCPEPECPEPSTDTDVTLRTGALHSRQSSCTSKQSNEAARLNISGTFAEAAHPITKSLDTDEEVNVITSLREELVCAVERGDWENAESKAAAIMFQAISNDDVQSLDSLVKMDSIKSLAACPSATDDEQHRIAELNRLIEAEDWQGVVATASTLHEGSSITSSSPTTFATAEEHSSGRRRRYSSTPESFETAHEKAEEDAYAQAEMWSDIARRSSSFSKDDGADIAAEWAISRSFSSMLEETIQSTQSSNNKPNEV